MPKPVFSCIMKAARIRKGGENMVKRYGAIVHPQEMDEAWLHRMKEAGLNIEVLAMEFAILADEE